MPRPSAPASEHMAWLVMDLLSSKWLHPGSPGVPCVPVALRLVFSLTGTVSLDPAPLLNFSLLGVSEAASLGPFALVPLVACLVLGLLYKSNEVCFVALPDGAIGLLPLQNTI